MIRILDRYVGLIFIRSVLISIVTFTAMFVLIDFFTRIWRFDPPLTAAAIYYILKFPEILYQMLPISTLMGTLITLGILSRSQELVAMQSSGFSLFRTTAPILIISACIGIAVFTIGDRIIPVSSSYAQEAYFTKVQRKHPIHSRGSIDLWYRSPKMIYNVKTIIPSKNRVEGITIYYLNDDFKPEKVISAFSGTYSDNSWMLEKGKVVIFDPTSDVPHIERFEQRAVNIDETPEDLASVERHTETMSLKSLKRFIKRNREAGFNTTRHEVALQAKFSLSFACVIFAFLAIPFGVSRGKHGGFARDIGLCLVVTFIYWTFLTVCISLGYNGTLPPFFAAWAPNVVFAGIGYTLLHRSMAV